MGNHKASQNADSSATHNLEVPGSSPGWSTNKKKGRTVWCAPCVLEYLIVRRTRIPVQTFCTVQSPFAK